MGIILMPYCIKLFYFPCICSLYYRGLLYSLLEFSNNDPSLKNPLCLVDLQHILWEGQAFRRNRTNMRDLSNFNRFFAIVGESC